MEWGGRKKSESCCVLRDYINLTRGRIGMRPLRALGAPADGLLLVDDLV
jgi:hypothetical protein